MRVIISIILALVIFATADAQQNPVKDEGKKKTGINKPSGNPGDPNNAFKAQHPQKDSAARERATQQAGDNDQSLLGDDNAKSGFQKSNSGDNYRSNRVSGNPNNRNTAEGSNLRRAAMESDESSTGTIAFDSASMAGSSGVEDSRGSEGGAISNPQSSNVPAVSQESTSGSGSPAILSGEEGSERDGTNNVQRAKPNMAGSPVGNLKSGKRDIDPDSEIKKGTDKQQRSAAPKAVKQTRSGKKVSAGRSQQNDVMPNVAPDSQNVEQRGEVTSYEARNYPAVTKEEPSRVDKKRERKAKRKKRRNN